MPLYTRLVFIIICPTRPASKNLRGALLKSWSTSEPIKDFVKSAWVHDINIKQVCIPVGLQGLFVLYAYISIRWSCEGLTSISHQGLFVPFALVRSGDPVRIYFTKKYTGYSWSIYCQWLCTTCRYQMKCATTTVGCLWLCNCSLLTSLCYLIGCLAFYCSQYCTVPSFCVFIR